MAGAHPVPLWNAAVAGRLVDRMVLEGDNQTYIPLHPSFLTPGTSIPLEGSYIDLRRTWLVEIFPDLRAADFHVVASYFH